MISEKQLIALLKKEGYSERFVKCAVAVNQLDCALNEKPIDKCLVDGLQFKISAFPQTMQIEASGKVTLLSL